MDNLLPLVIAFLALGASIFPVLMVQNIWPVLRDFERRIKEMENQKPAPPEADK